MTSSALYKSAEACRYKLRIIEALHRITVFNPILVSYAQSNYVTNTNGTASYPVRNGTVQTWKST